jgi:serine/threonine-protein kinase
MATVWYARMHGAGTFTRSVAVKRLLPAIAEDEPAVAMFAEEARVTSELSHPNIVQVYDFVRDPDGRYLIIMEWVDGLDLARFVRAHKRANKELDWRLVTAIAIELLRGLGAAHGRVDADGDPAPVFHRDVTPANVMVSVGGIVKLTDFGMSRAMDRATITQPGVLKGKMPYMAPEYVGGGVATAQTDLWSVGAILWEALVGKRLRDSKDPVTLYGMSSQIPPHVTEHRSDVPEELADVIAQVLAIHPDQRYQTAREIIVDLSAVLRRHDPPTDEVPLGEAVRRARRWLGPPRSLDGTVQSVEPASSRS